MRGQNAVSVIIEALGGNFGDKLYSIFVSNEGVDFIKLRDVKMSFGTMISNSFTVKNQMRYGNPIYWQFMKVLIPVLGEGIKAKILISGR